MVRWDRRGVLEPGGSVQTLSLVTNYTAEVEYLNYIDTSVCLDYGPDAFYNWCFGAAVGQQFVQNITIDGMRSPRSRFLFGCCKTVADHR